MGFEPTTTTLATWRSTPELLPLKRPAGGNLIAQTEISRFDVVTRTSWSLDPRQSTRVVTERQVRLVELTQHFRAAAWPTAPPMSSVMRTAGARLPNRDRRTADDFKSRPVRGPCRRPVWQDVSAARHRLRSVGGIGGERVHARGGGDGDSPCREGVRGIRRLTRHRRGQQQKEHQDSMRHWLCRLSRGGFI